jgi:hypothetical protein
MRQQPQPGLFPWLGIFAAAVVVLGGGWYFEARARRQDAAEVQARLDHLEHDRLQSEDRRPPRRAPATAFVHAPAPATGGPLGVGPLPRPLSPEERRRLQLQAISRLESRFSSDGSNIAWATSTEQAVQAAVEEPALAAFQAPRSSEVQCARTMCRMVFTFDSLDEAEDWASFYPLGLANQLPVFRNQPTTLPDGRVQLRMYGFRAPEAVPHG